MKIRLEITNDKGDRVYSVHETIYHANSGLDPWRKAGEDGFYLNLEQEIDDELVWGIEILPRIQEKHPSVTAPK